MTAINNSNIVTLSSLLAKDVPQAYILPERPSTFNHKARFVNDTKYIIHDYSSNITADHRYLKAMRACPVAGNELPILLTRPVNPLIREVRETLDYKHWSEWLPFLPKPDIRIFDEEDTKTRPMTVNFPFQSFPAEKHAVNPDIHYELSSKTKIPEMGAPCPRYMSRDNYTLPCMIKTTQGVGGRGVFLARNKDQAQKAFRELKTNFHCQEPVVTEVIQHVKEFLNVQLYLFQNGNSHWLGVRRKTDMAFREVYQAPIPDVDWNEQDQLRKVAWDVASPVMSYLHKHGFFGFVGVEILINNKGTYLIDVNLKTSDSTYLLLLAPHLAAFVNFPVSIVADIRPTSIEQLLEEIHNVNCEKDGRVIVLSGDEEHGGKPLNACVVVFSKDVETASLLHRELIISCALINHGIGDHNNKTPNGLAK